MGGMSSSESSMTGKVRAAGGVKTFNLVEGMTVSMLARTATNLGIDATRIGPQGLANVVDTVLEHQIQSWAKEMAMKGVYNPEKSQSQ